MSLFFLVLSLNAARERGKKIRQSFLESLDIQAHKDNTGQDFCVNLWVMDSLDLSNIKAKPAAVFSFGRRPCILLGACGCIAAENFIPLCQCFLNWAHVRGVVTESCLHFIDKASIIPYGVFDYEKELENGKMEIELLKWADIFVIAPLSANTLAKIVGGICDDLLTNIVRGWDPNKPFYVAPSMDPLTWNNPFSRRHAKYVVSVLGISLMPPDQFGEMCEPSEISYTVKLSNERIWRN